MSAAEVRRWATENGIDCPRVGRVPAAVMEAYTAEHGVSEPEPEPEPEDEEEFTVTVTIPFGDDQGIAQQLVNALYAAFEAGRAAERADLLSRLGGDR